MNPSIILFCSKAMIVAGIRQLRRNIKETPVIPITDLTEAIKKTKKLVARMDIVKFEQYEQTVTSQFPVSIKVLI